MADEADYTNLPLQDRLSHKVWKARLQAYEECIKLFENSRDEDDECFQMFNHLPDLLKSIVLDLNVVAQETGVLLYAKFLEFGGTSATVNKCKNSVGIIPCLCEKGLSSSRAGTKNKAVDCCLLMVEILSSPDGIIEGMLPYIGHRTPKLVAGVVHALGQIVDNFGCSVVKPTPIIEVLPKLFAHADRNVRTETSKLTVELYKWMKEALVTVLFDHLKPVQQKDLTKAFEEFQAEAPQQKRLTRAQQQQQRQQQQQGENDLDGDVIMEEENGAESSSNGNLGAQFDPFELMQPVDVLGKIAPTFSNQVSDANWKERKAALEEVYGIFSKAPKMNPNDDYGSIMPIFSKCMKDANIQVVQLAANCVECLAKGLRKKFHKYYSSILVAMLERTKEKKPSVVDALSNALDATFESTSLSDILEGTVATMSHKTPQVKISTTNFLQRCLSKTTVPPSVSEIDTIMSSGVKLLSDSQEPVRQAATQMIGTLMKITGERELRQSLEKVDENRKSKIFKFYESVEVRATGSTKAGKSSVSNSRPSSSGVNSNGSLLKKPSTTIPSKRLATSPAKRGDQQQKVASYGRSLTGRPLASTNNSTIPKLSPAVSAKPDQMEIDSEELNELRALREEKKNWLVEKQQLNETMEKHKGDNMALTKEMDQLRSFLEKANKEANNSTLMVQQKESQISRLNNDMDNAKLKIRDLEQTIEMMKLQQKQQANHKPPLTTDSSLPSLYGSRSTSPHKSDEPRSRITSGELSSRVNRLSIDSENRPEVNKTSPRKPFDDGASNDAVNLNDNNESWQKAALVTSQLKARIEKMKARNKSPSFNME